jgi:hypothetical protein
MTSLAGGWFWNLGGYRALALPGRRRMVLDLGWEEEGREVFCYGWILREGWEWDEVRCCCDLEEGTEILTYKCLGNSGYLSW